MVVGYSLPHSVEADDQGGRGSSTEDDEGSSPEGTSTAPLRPASPGEREDGDEEEEEQDAPENAQLDLLQSAMQLAVVNGSLTRYLNREQRVAVTFERARKRLQAIQEIDNSDLFEIKSEWRDFLRKLHQRWDVFKHSGQLWKSGIQAVEGKHGSNVSLTFYFMRFSLYLNVVLMAVWLALTVIPSILDPPPTFQWSIFKTYSVLQLLQGFGLDSTFWLYGGYTYTEGPGFYSKFRPDLTFPVAAVATYAIVLVALLYTINQRQQGVGDGAFVGQNRLFPFCTVVFTSWDFHLTDAGAAKALRHSIRNQLKEMVGDAEREDAVQTAHARCLSRARKVVGCCLLWPLAVAGAAAATYFIVTQINVITSRLHTAFAGTIMLSAISVASGTIVPLTVYFEKWSPRTENNMLTVRLLSVRIISMVTFVYQLYRIQVVETTSMLPAQACNLSTGSISADASCPGGNVCCDSNCAATMGSPDYAGRCVPWCSEDSVGMIFYRLVISNIIVLNLVDILSAAFFKLIRAPSAYDSAGCVIATIDNAALVWLGSVFAPLLPIFGALSNVMTFHTKRVLAMWLYEPPKTNFSASRTSVMGYSLMLGALAACTVPLVFNLNFQRTRCGPHMGTSMVGAITSAINNGPSIVRVILLWLVSPIVLGTLCLVLAFVAMINASQRTRYKRKHKEMRLEFDKYRKEMQAKVVVSRRKQAAAEGGESGSSSPRSASLELPIPGPPLATPSDASLMAATFSPAAAFSQAGRSTVVVTTWSAAQGAKFEMVEARAMYAPGTASSQPPAGGVPSPAWAPATAQAGDNPLYGMHSASVAMKAPGGGAVRWSGVKFSSADRGTDKHKASPLGHGSLGLAAIPVASSGPAAFGLSSASAFDAMAHAAHVAALPTSSYSLGNTAYSSMYTSTSAAGANTDFSYGFKF